MKYDPQKHHRRSIRLKGYDYSQPGAYFVTLVAYQREALYGEIIHGVVHPNELSFLAMNEWRRLGERFAYVIANEFIVMPNHIHGVLFIRDNESIQPMVGAGHEDSTSSGESSFASPLHGPPRHSLGAVVGAYKSTTARLINGLRRAPGMPVWQRNYYEHIVRDDSDYARIIEYIRTNPQRWEADQLHPAAGPNPFNQR